MKLTARTSERIAKVFILSIAVLIMGILIWIIGDILLNGIPHINFSFLSQMPRNMGREGGIFPTIVGTLMLTVLAILIAVPFGVGAAYYLAEYTKGGIVTRIIRFGAESLAGIPSIVYGIFGVLLFVEILGLGFSIISGALTVSIMILPTIIRTSEEALLAVPKIYRDASFSLGATKWQTIRCAVTPTAIRGIVNGVILGVGRCVAETAAVMLTMGGNVLAVPSSISSSGRTMAVHFYILAQEGVMQNAYTTAAILIILIFIINIGTNAVIDQFISKRTKGAR
ncbi:MAG: phosphate ABC transporter permease PstA [Defluviitaleaceae bacterium]|nr:phosphate ABC transporter permease PstA [Defluviitaleaceae bacterium]